LLLLLLVVQLFLRVGVLQLQKTLSHSRLGGDMRKTVLFQVLFLALSLSCLALPNPTLAQVSVGISVRIGPPPLPVYVQPICPGPDYIWVPGYWAWGPDGYYWVPGTWVLAPEPGLFWTPGWWGFAGGVYVWHPGYWGLHVGFYGGINYGFGYFGIGYVGGEWRGRHFYYNRAMTNVNVNVVRNVYVNRTVVRNLYVENRVSYNGGTHGVNARPTRDEQHWDRERRYQRTSEQNRHDMEARNNRELHYSNNRGHPPVVATQRPGEFSGPGVVHPGARSNEGRPPATENRPRGGSKTQPNDGRGHPNYTSPSNEPRSSERQKNEQHPVNQGEGRGRSGEKGGGDHGRDHQ
jgi:hypothetical protein